MIRSSGDKRPYPHCGNADKMPNRSHKKHGSKKHQPASPSSRPDVELTGSGDLGGLEDLNKSDLDSPTHETNGAFRDGSLSPRVTPPRASGVWVVFDTPSNVGMCVYLHLC